MPTKPCAYWPKRCWHFRGRCKIIACSFLVRRPHAMLHGRTILRMRSALGALAFVLALVILSAALEVPLPPRPRWTIDGELAYLGFSPDSQAALFAKVRTQRGSRIVGPLSVVEADT